MRARFICDCCERIASQIHRKYLEKGFCVTCYRREFPKKSCWTCGKVARIHISEEECQDCLLKKPCIRCLREGRPVGKCTKEGVVCNSCAVHYRIVKPCERCGVLTKRLTKISRFNDGLKVCTKCSVRDHQTCPMCKRHRMLEPSHSNIDLKVCKKCNTHLMS